MSLKSQSVVATAVMLLAIAGLISAHALLARHPVAVAVQVVAVLFALGARVTLGLRSFHMAANPTAGGLVTTGLYHYVRHPIYAAVLLLIWAGVTTNNTTQSLGLAAVATAALAVRIRGEERLVAARYPAYAAYAARTKRLIPWVL